VTVLTWGNKIVLGKGEIRKFAKDSTEVAAKAVHGGSLSPFCFHFTCFPKARTSQKCVVSASCQIEGTEKRRRRRL